MSLNKAIKYGKEHRHKFYGSKAIDPTCRNHGSCPVCAKNRVHKKLKQMPIDEFGNIQNFGVHNH